jgi:hypothetical protein
VAKKVPAGASLCTTAVDVGVGAWAVWGFGGGGAFEQEQKMAQDKITTHRAAEKPLTKNVLYVSRNADRDLQWSSRRKRIQSGM